MAEIEDNVDRELFRNIEKLRQLRIEHRDLDEVIERLTMDIHTNELQLKRLKKRKLMLKDQITRMESQLIPDFERVNHVDNADSGVMGVFVRLTSPQILTEVIAIACAGLIALAGAQVVKAWHRRNAATGRPEGWQADVQEGSVIVAPYLVALIVLLIVRAILGSLHGHTAAIDTALQLTTALVLVRLGVYLLRVMMGADSWIRTWENRITLVIWVLMSFSLVGWLDVVESTLSHVNLIPGKSFSLWALLKGLVVVSTFVIVTSLIARALEKRVMRAQQLAVSTRIGISKFAYFILVSIGAMLGINQAGVDVTTLNVLTGAIGLGLGFGLQAIASNFVSGFVLLIDKSIKPGDVISFTGHTGTSTENFGWVQELRGRYVVVRDRDGVETLVPNQNLITNSVINWSYSDQRVRIRLPVVISYDDDPEFALKLLFDAVANHPRILHDPPPVTRLMAFEDYGMRIEVRFWIADPMNGVNNVRSDVNRAIWRLFKDNGVKIPVAQRELRMLDPYSGLSNRQRNLGSIRMAIEVTPNIVIPDGDISLSFVRGSGPGGQNVNKVASAVQLRFDLAGTVVLSDPVKSRLRALAGRRLTDDGAILIIARNHRTQEQNRREAGERLTELIKVALIPPKPRKKTKPTRASKERRLETKTRTQRTKGLRGKVKWD